MGGEGIRIHLFLNMKQIYHYVFNPDPMKAWVEGQVDGGQYGNASDYVRDLIRRDQNEREQIKALQTAITKGLASGISDRSMQDILKEARSNAKATKHAL